MNHLSDETLNKMRTSNLLRLYHSVRNQTVRYLPHWMEYEDLDEREKLNLKYCDKLKALLDTREHVSRPIAKARSPISPRSLKKSRRRQSNSRQ